MQNIFKNENIECSLFPDRITKLNGKEFPRASFETYSYIELDEQRKRWYPNGKKIVPKDVRLTPIVLAQWYMGDGNLELKRKASYRITFCTDSFTKEENNFLANILKEKYGYTLIVRRYKKEKGYRIFMSRQDDVKDFLLKTSPYKVSCFDYKWRALNDPLF